MKPDLDQFYTDPKLARRYVAGLARRYPLGDMAVVEPSAGSGSFSIPLREVAGSLTAIDLDPVPGSGVVEGDFLFLFDPPRSDRIAVVGNPPFGFASSLAIQFFNEAAQWAEIIAFIVPRTFRKMSVVDKLDPYFVKRHDVDVPYKSFIRYGEPYDVPCAWQIWERISRRRPAFKVPDVSNLIEYVRSPEEADFALRRVGGRSGQVLPLNNGQRYSPSSTYFIRDRCGWAQGKLAKVDWSHVRDNTAGVRSVSKREIARELVA